MAPLAGTRLGLYAGETGGSPLYECVSDGDGDCNFTVPGLSSAAGPRYWVREVQAAPGYFGSPQLQTGGSASLQTTAYRFQTPQLRGGQTYSSTSSGTNGFMLASGSETRAASNGVWQQSRDNPPLPATCGMRVALVLDLSGSMNGSIGALKNASDTFVDALQGTPSSMAMFTFSSYSPATNGGPNRPALQSVATRADATAFKQNWASWTEATANGATNWDRGLYVPATETGPYDVAVVVTDGNPTRYSVEQDPQGSGSFTRFREMENGIFSANALKARGTRVLAVGVGAGITSAGSAYNLRAISGPTRFSGGNIETADYFQESSFAQAGAALRELALQHCTPSVSVLKQIEAPDGSRSNAPAGWTFDGSTGTAGVTVQSPQTTTNDGTGAVNFPLAYNGATSATLDIAERQHPGYQVVPQDGRNAQCFDKVSEAPVDVTDDPGGGPGFSIDVPHDASVTCTVVDRAPPDVRPASVVVAKHWVLTTGDGTRTYPDGEQPTDLNAVLTLTGPRSAGASDQDWSQPRIGYAEGDEVRIGERPELTPGLDCTLTSVTLDGTELDPADPATDVTLAEGENRHTMTNHVDCTTRLTLAKQVVGGNADPTSWTLRAIGAPDALPGPDGVSGSPAATADVSPFLRYQLAERLDSRDPALLNYRQLDRRTSLQSNPLSTGSMSCVGLDRDGTEVGGWSDGINGGVNVPLGLHAVCTATNETVPLTLIKKVEGGSAAPSDWRLTATPVPPQNPPDGYVPPPAQTVAGAADPGATIHVRPGQEYRISESGGPAHYTLRGVRCTATAGGVPAGDTVTVASQQRGSCTVTNEYRPPSPSPSASSTTGPPPSTSAGPSSPASGGGPPASGGGGAPPTGAGPPLPITGTPLARFGAAALLLLAAGTGLVLWARRRRT